MAEPSPAETPEASTPKLGAPKDKNCPYCGQAFTSSSLGRHLDLYIKEKNPKPPDGIHDIDAIKKLRGGITRRHTRGSISGRREASNTPTGTPQAFKKEQRTALDLDTPNHAKIPKDGQYVVDTTLSKYPFPPCWDANGVASDVPPKSSADNDAATDSSKQPAMARTVSKQMMQKAQFDVKQKLADAMDTARAAEMALCEVIGSWRSAKQEVRNNSMPFDFDPLSLDFPALALQCLKPPPTLFSSTQHATSTSWSVQPPGRREFGALRAYFDDTFRARKATCASATSAVAGELVTPPAAGLPFNVRDSLNKAEKTVAGLEKQVSEHVASAFAAWETLSEQRRAELWVLELARGVGRKQKEIEKMEEFQYRLRQENAYLKTQNDQLIRMQQSREFNIVTPLTFQFDRDSIVAASMSDADGFKSTGFDIADRQFDLSTVVARSIGRWKNAIASARISSSGMAAQKPLEPFNDSSVASTASSSIQSQSVASAPARNPTLSRSQSNAQVSPVAEKRQSVVGPAAERPSPMASPNDQTSEHTAHSTNNTAPPSVAETSDQDADAEMEDDDSFAMVDTPPVKQPQIPMQQHNQLDVSRTRARIQQSPGDMRYMMSNAGNNQASQNAMAMSRPMPNMGMAMQGNAMQDISMAMQGVRGDMYME